jgi:hypothetical protein
MIFSNTSKTNTPPSYLLVFSLLLNSLEGCRQMGESLGLDASKALDEMNSLNMAGCTKKPLRLNEILSKGPDIKSAL